MAHFDELQAEDGFKSISDEALWDVIQERYDVWKEATWGMRSQWRMNALMARGFQWSVLNSVTQHIVQPVPPRNRRNITMNLIKPWLLDTEAKLDIAVPTFDVTPNTLSQEDKDAAIAGETIGQHYWRKLKIRLKWREGIARNCLHFGGCFGVLDWDETIGPKFRRQGKVDEETGESEVEIETEGDITYKIWPSWAVFTDEMPGDLDDKLYVGLQGWMSLDQIRQRWVEGDKVEEEGGDGPLDDVAFILSQILSHAHMGSSTPVRRDKGATVYKFYMKPQKSVPKGLIAVVANGVVLEKNDWPEAFLKMDGYPIIDYNWYVHPSQYRGTAPIEDQIETQKEINKTASQIRENMDSMLALKWMNPIGSGVEDIDDLAGQIVDYMPGFMPTISQPGPLPAYVFRYMEELLLMMEDMQMLHKPSKGKVPAGVKSGVGIEMLQEQDDRPLSTPEASLHAQLTLTFRKILQIVSVAVKTKRMTELAGPNRGRQIRAFQGADLRDNTDIHLSVVGGTTKSKPAIIKRILDMVQMGMFRDKGGGVDTGEIMDMIRTAIPDVIYEQRDVDTELARDENDILWSNQPAPIPQRWESHFTHMPRHEEDMNSVKWKQQAQADPRWAARWIAHLDAHAQFIQASIPDQVGEQRERSPSASQES